MIAKGARGSMRDALSLTDQAIAFSASNISANAVKEMLGATDSAQIEAILRALIARDGVALVQVAEQMAAGSTSFYDATIELAQVLYRISLAQIVPDALPGLAVEQNGAQSLRRKWALMRCNCITASSRRRVSNCTSPRPQAGFTMMLLRLLAFVPEQTISG